MMEQKKIADIIPQICYIFVVLTIYAHMQAVERMWCSPNWSSKRMSGTLKHHLGSYMAQYM
jgi:hypothetical protein